MNRIISINLCGIIFQIDETAFESLKNYLADIKKHLGNTASSQEVYQDVENRIAELFQQKMNDGAKAILPNDVNEVIELMGVAEQFKDIDNGEQTEHQASSNQHTQQTTANQFRRIYRNPDDKVLSGVCSGLAAYFGVDPIIIRLAFVALFFIGGSSFLIYLICWMAIPKAETAAEKRAMFGKPISFEDVKKNIKHEANQVKDNVERMGNNFSRGQHRSTIIDVFRVLLKIVALLFLIFGLIIILPIAFAIIVAIVSVGFVLPFGLAYFIGQDIDSGLLLTSICLVVFIPIVTIIYKLFRLIFNSSAMSGWLKSTLTFLWFGAIVFIIFVANKVSKDFKYNETITEHISLKPAPNKVLLLESDNNIFNKHQPLNIGWQNTTNFSNNFIIDTIMNANVNLTIQPSADSAIHVIVYKYASGNSSNEAKKRAEQIVYNFTQTDSIIQLPHYFTKPAKQNWRNQKVRVTLQVPTHQAIQFTQRTLDMIDDDNFNIILENDLDIIGAKWHTSANGLRIEGK